MSNKSGVVRLKKGKQTFEVLVNSGTVEKYRSGNINWDKVPFVDAIFKNSSKGDRYTNSDLKKAFNTDNLTECMQTIVEKGEYRLDAVERKKKLEDTRKRIINYIHKYWVDSKTDKPIPTQRVEQSLKKIKYNINMDDSVEKQVQKIIKQLRGVLFMKKAGQMFGTLTIPHKYLGKCMQTISQSCTIKSQDYDANGSKINVEICSGDFDNLMKQLSSQTKGDFQFDVLQN